MSKKRRIGFLYGSFNPVHHGNIDAALTAIDSGNLDRLLVIPFRDVAPVTGAADAEDRWKMVVSMCAADSRLIPSRLDLERAGPFHFMVLLSGLKKEYPESELVWVYPPETSCDKRFLPAPGDLPPSCSVFPLSGSGAYGQSRRNLPLENGKRVPAPAPVPCTASDDILHAALLSGKLPDVRDIPVLEYCRCKGLYGLSGKIINAGAWIDRLFSSLKPRRFAHTLSVAWTAARLAAIHGIDALKAEQAGLLHDCAKCLPLTEMQRIAKKNSLTEDRAFLESDSLLHSLVGAQVASEQYGMKDPEVLDAIRFHNTGFPGMSRLAMCVCLADSIEPLRPDYPLLEKVRKLSEHSLEGALLLSLEGTADYVTRRGKYLHPRTGSTISWLRSISGGSGC